MATTDDSPEESLAGVLYKAIEGGTPDEEILTMLERTPDLVKCLLWMRVMEKDGSRVGFGGVLHCSAYCGRDSLVDKLLEYYRIDVTQKTTIDQRTPLLLASMNGHASIVEVLLNRGADVGCVDKKQRTPLHLASFHGHLSVVEALLNRGAEAFCVDEDRRTPLHFASIGGNESVVEVLLNRGADVGCVDKDQQTPLHFASIGGNESVVEVLLNRGADVGCVDEDQQTPLHLASVHGHLSVVEALLNRLADVGCVDKDQRTPLHLACHCIPAEMSADDVWFFEDCVDQALQPSIPPAERHRIVEALLNRGADVGCVDKDQQTPLHLASRNRHLSAVEALLNRGADFGCVDKDGNTPLHLAAQGLNRMFRISAYQKVVDKLVESGLNPLTKNKVGQTALEDTNKEECKRVLRVIEANYLLRGVAKAKAKRVRASVLGDTAVGKSELVSTLTSPDAKGHHSTPPEEDTAEFYAQRTPGIAISELINDQLEAILQFMDYAGQPEFLAGHSPLMVTSYGLYMIILDLLRGVEQMLLSARKWLRFIVSKRDTSLVPDSTPPRLFAVFSHADKVSPGKSSTLARRVYRRMKKEFREYFTWMGSNPFVVNCQEGSPEMNRLLDALFSGHSEVTKEMPREPVINDKIRCAIDNKKAKAEEIQAKTGSRPSLVLSLDQYHEFLEENVSLELTENNEEALRGSLQLLDLQGDVLLIKAVFNDDNDNDDDYDDDDDKNVIDSDDCDDDDDNGACQASASQKDQLSTAGAKIERQPATFVVLDPAWFCRDILKVILSPPEFPCAEIEFPDHGVCEEEEIDDALKSAKIHPAIGKAFLEASNICGRNVPRDNEFFCPYHLRPEAPAESWEQNNAKPPQGGILLYCKSSPASPVLMAHLQLAFCKLSGGVSERTCIWKKGLIFQWNGFVTIKMEQHDGEHDVNLIARANPGQLTQCATALGEVGHIAMTTARVVTPGSGMEVRYLSPTDVGKYAPPSKSYSAEEVIECSKRQTNLQHGGVTDDPRLILPVVQACRRNLFGEHGQSHRTRSEEKQQRPRGGPTLLAIAEHLLKRDDCLHLSQVIGASAAARARLECRNPSFFSCSDAFDMLLSWWREQAAHGGRVLCDALSEIGRADLAEKFNDELLLLPDVRTECVQVVSPTDFGKVLHDVSLLLADRMHTLKVGYELCASASAMAIVEDVEEACYHRGCAKQMLKQWWSEQSGSDAGAQLYRALVNAGRRDIAESFEQQLLQGYMDD